MTAEEFTQIYNEYADMVYRVGLFILGQREDAEDIVQQTFVKLYQHRTVFSAENQRKAWLIKTAKNAAYDLLKCAENKKRIWEDETEVADSQVQHAYPEPEAVILGDDMLLQGLETGYRLPLYLFYYEGYNTKEIADILKISEMTVRTRLSRGRKKLKKILGGMENDNFKIQRNM